MTAATRKPKQTRRLWLWAIAAVVVLGIIFFLVRGSLLGNATQQAETLETLPLTPQSYTLTVTGPGKLVAMQSRDIAPEVSGIVASVLSVGERVTAGQPLAQLETGTLERAVRDAEVALEQAQAQRESSASSKSENNSGLQENILNAQRAITNAEREVQTKRDDLSLKQRLVSVGSESSEALRTAQNAYDVAVAALEQARLNLQTLQETQNYRASSNAQDLRNADLAITAAELTLERAKADLAKASIVAPFAGVVTNVQVKQGTPISSSTTLLTLIDDTSMELPAQIDETQIAKVSLGQTATVTLEALPGETFQGQVTKLAPVARIEQNIPIFDVTILLGNTDGKLRPGMSAQAKINVGEATNTVRVPTRAVQVENGRSSIQVQGTDGSISSQPVTVIASEGFDSILEGEFPKGSNVVVPPLEAVESATPIF